MNSVIKSLVGSQMDLSAVELGQLVVVKFKFLQKGNSSAFI